MIRGTTATFKFKLPHELQYITWVSYSFWQDGYEGDGINKLPIQDIIHPKSNCETLPEDDPYRTSKELVIVLSGNQTKKFTDKLKARVQLKGMNAQYEDDDGNIIHASSFGSKPQLFTVYPMDNIVDGGIDEEDSITKDGYVILSGGNIVSVTEDGGI